MTVQKWIIFAHIVQPEVYMLEKQKYADANNEEKTLGVKEDPKDPAKVSEGKTNKAR